MSGTAKIFDFEWDISGTLSCIPMSTRLKLDRCGVKLSLKQWNRFTREQRDRLVDQDCDDSRSIQEYRDHLVHLIETQTKDKAEFIPVDVAGAEWNNPDQVPARLNTHTQNLGLSPLSPKTWSALTPLQRFVLFKLTRPGHKNENFIPAMREFGLLD